LVEVLLKLFNGSLTRGAIRKFQKDNGLTVSGKLDENTAGMIYRVASLKIIELS